MGYMGEEKYTVKKEDIADLLAEENHIPKSLAWQVVESLAYMIRESDKIYVHGLGTFRKVTLPERVCRNPKTGSKVTVPESTRIRFRQSRSR